MDSTLPEQHSGPTSTGSVLSVLARLALSCPQVVPHLRVQKGPKEDEASAQPVPGCEGVLEVQDREDEAHKFT